MLGSVRVFVLAVLAAVLVIPLVVLTPPALASGPPPPSRDPFYRYVGPKPLRSWRPA